MKLKFSLYIYGAIRKFVNGDDVKQFEVYNDIDEH